VPYSRALSGQLALVCGCALIALLTGCVGVSVPDGQASPRPSQTPVESTVTPSPEAKPAYQSGPDTFTASAPGIDPSQTLLYFVQSFFQKGDREHGTWRAVVSLDASLQVDAEDGPALYEPLGPLSGDETLGVVLIHEGRGAVFGDTETEGRRSADVLLRKPDGSTVVVRVDAVVRYGPDWFTDEARMRVLPEWTEGPGWRLEWTGSGIAETVS
jgi:hypothetical protein